MPLFTFLTHSVTPIYPIDRHDLQETATSSLLGFSTLMMKGSPRCEDDLQRQEFPDGCHNSTNQWYHLEIFLSGHLTLGPQNPPASSSKCNTRTGQVQPRLHTLLLTGQVQTRPRRQRSPRPGFCAGHAVDVEAGEFMGRQSQPFMTKQTHPEHARSANPNYTCMPNYILQVMMPNNGCPVTIRIGIHSGPCVRSVTSMLPGVYCHVMHAYVS